MVLHRGGRRRRERASFRSRWFVLFRRDVRSYPARPFVGRGQRADRYDLFGPPFSEQHLRERIGEIDDFADLQGAKIDPVQRFS